MDNLKNIPNTPLHIIEVPSMSTGFIIDMGYLIFKQPDLSKWITDKEIEEDAIRFMTTGKSKFADMESEPIYKTGGIPLPSGKWKIIANLKEDNSIDYDVSILDIEQYKKSKLHANDWLRSVIKPMNIAPSKNYLILKNN